MAPPITKKVIKNCQSGLEVDYSLELARWNFIEREELLGGELSGLCNN